MQALVARIRVSTRTRGGRIGRTGEELVTAETEGQMIQRVMPDLMGLAVTAIS
jgi:type III restriction enzyme